MAKGRRSRDANVVSSRRLRPPPSPRSRPRVTQSSVRVVSPHSEPGIDDGRVWHPSGSFRPALTTDFTPVKRLVVRDRPKVIRSVGSTSKTVSTKSKKAHRATVNRFGPVLHSQTKAIVAFAEPKRVLVCVKRKERREVLHAKKKAGRSVRSPTWNRFSHISCRG